MANIISTSISTKDSKVLVEWDNGVIFEITPFSASASLVDAPKPFSSFGFSETSLEEHKKKLIESLKSPTPTPETPKLPICTYAPHEWFSRITTRAIKVLEEAEDYTGAHNLRNEIAITNPKGRNETFSILSQYVTLKEE